MNICFFFIFLLFVECFKCSVNKDSNATFEYDPNGYVIFCLCMGRFGNQAEHFLGSMSFAKKLNRTFVVPPFITYKNVPYKEWFDLEKLSEYHRIISAEDFMLYIAPTYWPKEKRHGFCWKFPNSDEKECVMKFGNPSTGYWNELGVDFVNNIFYEFSFGDPNEWNTQFPPNKYPVIALKGAPASYPMLSKDRHFQKFMVWSDNIKSQVDDYIKKTFNNEKFVGIHLRNGIDWENACDHLDKYEFHSYMASPQCLDYSEKKLSKNLCFPDKQTILKDLERVMVVELNRTIRNIYVATDKDPMIASIKNHLENFFDKPLNIVHHDPWLPVIDIATLGQSEYFIGNCVSSFTSFVKRERDINKKRSSFWAFN